jgi:hypothetical protein
MGRSFANTVPEKIAANHLVRPIPLALTRPRFRRLVQNSDGSGRTHPQARLGRHPMAVLLDANGAWHILARPARAPPSRERLLEGSWHLPDGGPDDTWRPSAGTPGKVPGTFGGERTPFRRHLGRGEVPGTLGGAPRRGGEQDPARVAGPRRLGTLDRARHLPGLGDRKWDGLCRKRAGGRDGGAEFAGLGLARASLGATTWAERRFLGPSRATCVERCGCCGAPPE